MSDYQENPDMKFAGLLLTFLSMASFATATPAVPEIDGASLATGFALASGALMVARGRRRK